MRLRPLRRNHVWRFEFVRAQTQDGRTWRILTPIDEHSRACRALKLARRINSLGVTEALADAMCLHGIPEHIRCDNGPELIPKALRKWVAGAGSQIQSIAPGSPWENGYCESFNGKLGDECLRQEIVYSLKEAQSVLGLWQSTYTTASDRMRRLAIGRPRRSATWIWPSGYPSPLPGNGLPLGSIQNTRQVTGVRKLGVMVLVGPN